jgi:drug/metabolite transporter (DMT)-like permease
MQLIGQLAALGTSFFFSIGPIFFTMAGRLTSAAIVNRTRLVFATIILMLVHWLIYGSPIPFSAALDRWWWLGLSGVIGLTLGDAALFQAFVQIGTRLTMLVFSTSPVFAALMAWLFLGETLAPIQWIGIIITVLGVTWTISERQVSSDNPTENQSRNRVYLMGLFFALLGALGQASGLITAKLGLYGDFPALSGQVIRMGIGAIAIWIVPLIRGQLSATINAFRNNPKAFRYISIAVFFGPVVGVYLSLVAVQFAPIGIASTLMALPPIILIPIDRFYFKEQISSRAIWGTIIAILGVAILFLS